MKKRLNWPLWGTVSLVFALVALNPLSADAQILRNLGKRVEQKVEEQANRRIERQVDKAIDRTMDKVEQGVEDAVKGEGKPAGQSGTDGQGNPTMSMGSIFGGADIVVKDQYKFALGVSYDMTSIDGSKEEQLPGTTLWLSNDSYVGVGSAMQQNMFMVIDSSGMITFMEDQKRYMAMGAGMIEQISGQAAEQAEAADTDYTFSRVGAENVLGLACDIYEVRSDDAQVRVWVTEALDMPAGGLGSAFASLARQGKTPLPANLRAQPPGMMLKMESTDPETGQRVRMEATEIHRDGKTLNTADYQRFGM